MWREGDFKIKRRTEPGLFFGCRIFTRRAWMMEERELHPQPLLSSVFSFSVRGWEHERDGWMGAGRTKRWRSHSNRRGHSYMWRTLDNEPPLNWLWLDPFSGQRSVKQMNSQMGNNKKNTPRKMELNADSEKPNVWILWFTNKALVWSFESSDILRSSHLSFHQLPEK